MLCSALWLLHPVSRLVTTVLVVVPCALCVSAVPGVSVRPCLLQPPFEAFGATYVMEIPDTVVEGHQGFTEGSEEYMVFEKVLLAEAGKAGLFPVSGLVALEGGEGGMTV